MIISKTFSELTGKEIWEIAMLRTNVFTLEQEIKEEELEVDDYKAIHYFIKNNDEIVSYARLIETNGKYYIGRVCTSKAFRNQGKQKQIINEIINKNKNIKTLYVSSQIQVVKFYLRFGFKEEDNTYMDAGILHQLLILEK